MKEPTDTDKYLQGKIMDHRFIEREREAYEARLKEVGRTVYIVENRCYGESKEKLISALDPDEEERRVLDLFLDEHSGPIISSDRSVNLLMAPFWEEVGPGVLKKRLGDKKVASSVFKKYPVPRYQPMTVVQEGLFHIEERNVRKTLPELIDPPEMIAFAYECAVAYLVRGKGGASRILERFRGDEIKLKAAKYAFVKHLDLEKTSGWSYTTHEMGYAQGLDEIVARIVTRDPDGFRKGLIELWKATGSTKELQFG